MLVGHMPFERGKVPIAAWANSGFCAFCDFGCVALVGAGPSFFALGFVLPVSDVPLGRFTLSALCIELLLQFLGVRFSSNKVLLVSVDAIPWTSVSLIGLIRL